MKCPECKQELYCPCSHCADRNKGKVMWKWDITGEVISCPECGLSMHADNWDDGPTIEALSDD